MKPDTELQLLFTCAANLDSANEILKSIWDSKTDALPVADLRLLRAKLNAAYCAALALERRASGESAPVHGP